MKLVFLFTAIILGLTPIAVHSVEMTFMENYTYTAGEADSKLSCRAISIIQVKRLLLEKIGTYVISSSEVKAHELTKDEIVTLTAGLVKTEIIEEKWDGSFYTLAARINVDPDLVASQIDEYKKSIENEDQIRKLENINDKSLKKINELKMELSDIQNNLVNMNRNYEETSTLINAWELFETGKELAGEGAFDEALITLSKAIDLNPKYNYFYHRGKVQMKLKQFKNAIGDFNQTLKLNPNVKDAYFQRGRAYRQIGKKNKGLMDIKESARRGSGNGKRWLIIKGKQTQ